MPPIPDPFSVTVEGDTLRLATLGSLVASNVGVQRAVLKEQLVKAKKAVVLDLGAAEMVDSLGITLVVGLFKSCQERKLTFSVEGVNPEVLRLFRFFRLNEVFDVRER